MARFGIIGAALSALAYDVKTIVTNPALAIQALNPFSVDIGNHQYPLSNAVKNTPQELNHNINVSFESKNSDIKAVVTHSSGNGNLNVGVNPHRS